MSLSRAITTKNLYEKKYITYQFEGIFKEVFGEPSKGGLWILYGKEKNGKTWGALLLAKEFVKMKEKVLYISAEEGFDKAFQEAAKRANIPANSNQLHYLEYEPMEKLKTRLLKRHSPSVIFVDNSTVYSDELKRNGALKLMREFPNKLFIFLSHEERNEPYTSAAKAIKKYSKIIMRAIGLQLQVWGRCPGGSLNIDENKAILYHGNN